jgi:hypothetical protein
MRSLQPEIMARRPNPHLYNLLRIMHGRKPKNSVHLIGVGLDNEDNHKRLTRSEQFSIIGGSKQTHEMMTETLIKTMEDVKKRGKRLETIEHKELSDLLQKHTPHK